MPAKGGNKGSPKRASRIYRGLPPHGPGQAIGLFGGTFNPPHDGHRQASLLALRRLGLDQLWWMVTPGNPLKKNGSLPTLAARMQAAAKIAAHPRIMVSGAEAMFRTRYTADLIQILKARHPTTRFVWIMGSDSLTDFHRWENWQKIAASVPIAVVNRPRSLAAPLSARAAHGIGAYRVDADDFEDIAEPGAAGVALSDWPQDFRILDRDPLPSQGVLKR